MIPQNSNMFQSFLDHLQGVFYINSAHIKQIYVKMYIILTYSAFVSIT